MNEDDAEKHLEELFDFTGMDRSVLDTASKKRAEAEELAEEIIEAHYRNMFVALEAAGVDAAHAGMLMLVQSISMILRGLLIRDMPKELALKSVRTIVEGTALKMDYIADRMLEEINATKTD